MVDPVDGLGNPGKWNEGTKYRKNAMAYFWRESGSNGESEEQEARGKGM